MLNMRKMRPPQQSKRARRTTLECYPSKAPFQVIPAGSERVVLSERTTSREACESRAAPSLRRCAGGPERRGKDTRLWVDLSHGIGNVSTVCRDGCPPAVSYEASDNALALRLGVVYRAYETALLLGVSCDDATSRSEHAIREYRRRSQLGVHRRGTAQTFLHAGRCHGWLSHCPPLT